VTAAEVTSSSAGDLRTFSVEDLVLDDVLVCDVVGGARAFRLAMSEWAKGYSAARELTSSPANDTEVTAQADLRRWSTRYFTPVTAAR
jgi:hypothetical protein